MKRLTSALLASLLVGTLATGCELKLNTDTNTSGQTGTQTGNTGDTGNSANDNTSTGNQNNNNDTGSQNNGNTSSTTCATAEVTLTEGSAVTDDFFCAYGPSQVKAGTSWTYVTSSLAGDIETKTEFTNVSGDSVTVKTTVNGVTNETTTKLNTAAKPSTDSSEKFIFAGYENVTVPAGTYSNAAKLTLTGKDEASGAETLYTYWFAKGVGMVQLTTDIKIASPIAIPPTTTKLKAFTP